MEWQDIIISVVSIVLTSFASWAMAKLVAWLNTKIKDSKTKALINEAIMTVTNVVEATYQTYVEVLKDTDAFTEEAQKTALNSALETAKKQLSNEYTTYLESNGIDLNSWLETQVESIIYELKNQNK